MTTKRPPVTADPWAQPAPLPPETPEETRRLALQSLKNQQLFADIFDDLLHKHRGRFVLIHGDQQILIGDDPLELEASLGEDYRETAVCMPIAPWWTELE